MLMAVAKGHILTAVSRESMLTNSALEESARSCSAAGGATGCSDSRTPAGVSRRASSARSHCSTRSTACRQHSAAQRAPAPVNLGIGNTPAALCTGLRLQLQPGAARTAALHCSAPSTTYIHLYSLGRGVLTGTERIARGEKECRVSEPAW